MYFFAIVELVYWHFICSWLIAAEECNWKIVFFFIFHVWKCVDLYLLLFDAFLYFYAWFCKSSTSQIHWETRLTRGIRKRRFCVQTAPQQRRFEIWTSRALQDIIGSERVDAWTDRKGYSFFSIFDIWLIDSLF